MNKRERFQRLRTSVYWIKKRDGSEVHVTAYFGLDESDLSVMVRKATESKGKRCVRGPVCVDVKEAPPCH